MTPHGQWRVVLDGNQHDGFNFTITPIGDVPSFEINAATGIRYVSNRVDFNLPLTGGEGGNLMAFAVAGTAVICIAFATFGVMKVKKTRIGVIRG